MRRSYKITLAFLIGCIIVIFLLNYLWVLFLNTPLISLQSKPVFVNFSRGSTLNTLTADLQRKKIMQYPQLFKLLVYLARSTHDLQAGVYELEPGTKPKELLHKLITGQVVLHPFTIIPGWTFEKILAELNNNPFIIHTIKTLSIDDIMNKIGAPGQEPEGRFFPDTYMFNSSTSDIRILRYAYELMQYNLMIAWRNRGDVNVTYQCPYKALIAASIIEKETGRPAEKPVIADIIQRRLQKNMYLQLDPTIIYALGDKFTGKLAIKDLNYRSPYNTYIYKGLPPTPICMPSANTLNAVMHPEKNDYLFFVAKGDGSHSFSVTLKQHNLAVQKYRQLANMEQKNAKTK